MIGSRLPEQYVADAALLSAVADPIRLQLVAQLAVQPSCVCNLVTDPEIPGNLLSYHLKKLRDAGLIEGTRRGRWIDYALTDGALDRLAAALPAAVDALPLTSAR
ncbi:ArsR/SmtB family transcription factor [Demequina rhizosphaerae]|uniref:ArsR/SmtB family transcription factor n=1 Tax=Demequina rhizosphaerae TaxID=1638985 RepID=UPI0007856FAB|nr:metalloregulator ArsR/SmtB family transcription factor [Demequina rhizosphaerae]